MGGGDALAGLEEIGWAGLRHAYGPAGDVPGLLRALVSASPAERRRALHELYGNIFHQGSRYEVTAHAVPFLVRLAVDPQTPRRDEIVRLLVALAIGYDEAYLPAGVDIAGWRAGIERMRSVDPAQQLRDLDAWVQAARGEADRRARGMQRAIYVPPWRCVPPWTNWPPMTPYGPRSPGCAGCWATAIRGSGPPPRTWWAGSRKRRRVRPARCGPRWPPRPGRASPPARSSRPGCWATAIALARLGVAGADVIGVLAAASAEPPRPGPGPVVSFLGGDLRGYAAQTLAMLDGHLPPSPSTRSWTAWPERRESPPSP